jgi:hypothetical protein
MDTEKLNRWLALCANIGVLVGIVLLVVELDQNSNIARLELELSRNEIFQQGEVALYGDRGADVWAKAVMDPMSLSPAEIRIMDGYLTNAVNRSQKVYDLELAGLREDGAALQYMREDLGFEVGNQFAQTWWAHSKDLWGDDEFARMLDSVISEKDPNFNKNRILGIQRDLAGQSTSNNNN